MRVILVFCVALSLAFCDKLDRTYLPPPGSKYAGGSPGSIQVPFEVLKQGFTSTITQGIRDQYVNPSGQSLDEQVPSVASERPVFRRPTPSLQPETSQRDYQPYLFPQSQSPSISDFPSAAQPSYDKTSSPTQDDFGSFSAQDSSRRFPLKGNQGQKSPQQDNNFGQKSSQKPVSQQRFPQQGEYQNSYDQDGIISQDSYGQRIPVSTQSLQPGYQRPAQKTAKPSIAEDYYDSRRPNYRVDKPSPQGPGEEFPKNVAQQPFATSDIREENFSSTLSPIQDNQRPSSSISGSKIVPSSQYDEDMEDFNPSSRDKSVSDKYGVPVDVSTKQKNGFSTTQYPNYPMPDSFTSTVTPKLVDLKDYPTSTLRPLQTDGTSRDPSYSTSTLVSNDSEIDLLTPRYFEKQYQQENTPDLKSRPERPKAGFDRNAYILNYENVITPDGFAFSFDTSNGIHADESGTATDGVKAQGGYSYIGDDGKEYSVIYSADENGFQPIGDHLPTPPPVPEAIQRVIEQANRDKAAGIINDGSYDDSKYGYKSYEGSANRKQPGKQTGYIGGGEISRKPNNRLGGISQMKPNYGLSEINRLSDSPVNVENTDAYDEKIRQSDNENLDKATDSQKPQISNQSKKTKIRPTYRPSITVSDDDGNVEYDKYGLPIQDKDEYEVDSTVGMFDKYYEDDKAPLVSQQRPTNVNGVPKNFPSVAENEYLDAVNQEQYDVNARPSIGGQLYKEDQRPSITQSKNYEPSGDRENLPLVSRNKFVDKIQPTISEDQYLNDEKKPGALTQQRPSMTFDDQDGKGPFSKPNFVQSYDRNTYPLEYDTNPQLPNLDRDSIQKTVYRVQNKPTVSAPSYESTVSQQEEIYKPSINLPSPSEKQVFGSTRRPNTPVYFEPSTLNEDPSVKANEYEYQKDTAKLGEQYPFKQRYPQKPATYVSQRPETKTLLPGPGYQYIPPKTAYGTITSKFPSNRKEESAMNQGTRPTSRPIFNSDETSKDDVQSYFNKPSQGQRVYPTPTRPMILAPNRYEQSRLSTTPVDYEENFNRPLNEFGIKQRPIGSAPPTQITGKLTIETTPTDIIEEKTPSSEYTQTLYAENVSDSRYKNGQTITDRNEPGGVTTTRFPSYYVSQQSTSSRPLTSQQPSYEKPENLNTRRPAGPQRYPMNVGGNKYIPDSEVIRKPDLNESDNPTSQAFPKLSSTQAQQEHLYQNTIDPQQKITTTYKPYGSTQSTTSQPNYEVKNPNTQNAFRPGSDVQLTDETDDFDNGKPIIQSSRLPYQFKPQSQQIYQYQKGTERQPEITSTYRPYGSEILTTLQPSYEVTVANPTTTFRPGQTKIAVPTFGSKLMRPTQQQRPSTTSGSIISEKGIFGRPTQQQPSRIQTTSQRPVYYTTENVSFPTTTNRGPDQTLQTKRPEKFGTQSPEQETFRTPVRPGVQQQYFKGTTSTPFEVSSLPNQVIGEDFSGPKQAQRFDQETGYHYK